MSIATSCAQCCFAIRDEDGHQTGCEAGRLDAFRTAGASVVDDNGDSRSYKIEARICNLCRNTESPWAAEVQPELRLRRAQHEAQVRLHIVIHIGSSANIGAIEKTIRSLVSQSPTPTVHFVLNGCSVTSTQVLGLLRRRGPDLATNVRTVVESLGTRGQSADLVAASLRPSDCNFYLLVDAGKEVPAGLCAGLERAINQEMRQFVLLGSKTPGVGPLVHFRMHHLVNGNAEAEYDVPGGTAKATSVEEKIRLVVKNEAMLGSLEELC